MVSVFKAISSGHADLQNSLRPPHFLNEYATVSFTEAVPAMNFQGFDAELAVIVLFHALDSALESFVVGVLRAI